MFGVLLLYLLFQNNPEFQGTPSPSAEGNEEPEGQKRDQSPRCSKIWKYVLAGFCAVVDVLFFALIWAFWDAMNGHNFISTAINFVPGRTTELHVSEIWWSDSFPNAIERDRLYCDNNPAYCGNLFILAEG